MWILSYCLGVQYSHYKLMDGLSHNLCLNFDAMMTGIIIAHVPTASKRRSRKQQPQRGSNNHKRVSILFTQWSQTPSDSMYSCFAHQYFWSFPFPSTFPACWYKSCAAESSCSFLLWGDRLEITGSWGTLWGKPKDSIRVSDSNSCGLSASSASSFCSHARRSACSLIQWYHWWNLTLSESTVG